MCPYDYGTSHKRASLISHFFETLEPLYVPVAVVGFRRESFSFDELLNLDGSNAIVTVVEFRFW